MRTNIVIDEQLMQAAMRASGLPTKRAVVEEALQVLIQVKRQGDIRRLRGKITWEGDLTDQRTTRINWGACMVIVDTTVWIDYFGGFSTPETDWLDVELSRQRLGLTDLILCEVLQGIRAEREFERVRRELLKLKLFETGGRDLAIASAQNFRRLRSKGLTVRKTIDCLIASFCLLNGHALLHHDRDYDHFESVLGLVVVHPW
jgi:predicted nucleic acid-binding protein/Arc/MetJ family transcription regulator